MNAGEVMKLLENLAPVQLAEPWDHVGFQVGDEDRPVSRVLVALDLETSVIEEAIRTDSQMILTHHPLIFKALTAVTSHTREGLLIQQLIKNDMAYGCAHTNLDKTMVSMALATRLGLDTLEQDDKNPFMVIGRLPAPEIRSIFAKRVQRRLGASVLKLCGVWPEKIQRVAVIGGAGGDMFYDAAEAGAQVLVTGEIKYHESQQAAIHQIAGVAAGHDVTERIVLEPWVLALQKRADELQCKIEFICAQTDTCPYEFLC